MNLTKTRRLSRHTVGATHVKWNRFQVQCSGDTEGENKMDTTEGMPELVSETHAQDHLSKALFFLSSRVMQLVINRL